MRTFLALWLFANGCHGRFTSEAPSLIEKMVAVGDNTLFHPQKALSSPCMKLFASSKTRDFLS